MPDNHTAEGPAGFLARLNALETVVLAVIALVALAGLMLVGKGFYMKATADLLEGSRSKLSALDRSVHLPVKYS